MRRLIFLALLTVSVTASFAQARVRARVGDKIGGGVVFWVDPKSGGAHGLMADPYDAVDTLKWDACLKNVKYMTLGGHTDWRVPTKEELNLIYQAYKKHILTGLKKGNYWSISTRDDDGVWYQDFSTGIQNFSKSKFEKFNLRAIRTF